jgi:hypothetical protein
VRQKTEVFLGSANPETLTFLNISKGSIFHNKELSDPLLKSEMRIEGEKHNRLRFH